MAAILSRSAGAPSGKAAGKSTSSSRRLRLMDFQVPPLAPSKNLRGRNTAAWQRLAGQVRKEGFPPRSRTFGLASRKWLPSPATALGRCSHATPIPRPKTSPRSSHRPFECRGEGGEVGSHSRSGLPRLCYCLVLTVFVRLLLSAHGETDDRRGGRPLAGHDGGRGRKGFAARKTNDRGKVGGRWRFPRTSADAWYERIVAAAEAAVPKPKRPRGRPRKV